MKLNHGEYRKVGGQSYGTPKEVFGFRPVPLRGTTPLGQARSFLRSNSELLGLGGQLGKLKQRAVLRSLGATHVILQQQYEGAPVHRGFVTVHIDNDQCGYLIKNRCVPRQLLGGELLFNMKEARAKSVAREYLGVSAKDCMTWPKVDRRWLPLGSVVRAAYRVRLRLEKPRQDWIVYVDANDGTVVHSLDNVATATGRGRVFDPNPVIAQGGHRALIRKGKPQKPKATAYREVKLEGLDGGPHLDGARVSTSLTPRRRTRPNRDFLYDSNQRGFQETMAYYHLDRAIAYVESLGYTGAFAIFDQPLQVNAYGTREDNAFYDPSDRSLEFGTGGVDCAEDGETILHEFGHAIQDFICPDFGQSPEALAMGEGFGDYFAASYFRDKKRPKKLKLYRGAVMSWDGITYEQSELPELPARLPPSVRRVDVGWTFDDWVDGDGPHSNGEIWSRTLWDIRRRLGRGVADTLIVESHFQQDAFTTFARGARAILDADRNLNGGKHVGDLERVFARRRIGPV